MLLATVVVIITSAVVANATQTITTPNAAFISYNLASGANSAAITPATNKAVLVMGCNTTLGGAAGDQGVGQVSLLHSSAGGITWAGYESNPNVAFTQGSTSGTAHIVYIDSSEFVDIQVASANTIVVHNRVQNFQAVAGSVTLVW